MATNKKPKFKEKIVALYDSVFEGKTTRTNFWNEFFLIRPKRDALIAKIKSLLDPKYLHVLVQQSVLSCVEGNAFQKVNALQTLVSLLTEGVIYFCFSQQSSSALAKNSLLIIVTSFWSTCLALTQLMNAFLNFVRLFSICPRRKTSRLSEASALLSSSLLVSF